MMMTMMMTTTTTTIQWERLDFRKSSREPECLIVILDCYFVHAGFRLEEISLVQVDTLKLEKWRLTRTEKMSINEKSLENHPRTALLLLLSLALTRVSSRRETGLRWLRDVEYRENCRRMFLWRKMMKRPSCGGSRRDTEGDSRPTPSL